MRTIISIIVVLSGIFLVGSFANASKTETESDIFTDRGLLNGKCYRENATYECSADCKKCTIHLFHGIKAQLSFPAKNMEVFCKHFKSDSGTLSFKFQNKNNVAVADVFGFIQTKKEISETITQVSKIETHSTACPKY